MASLWKWGEEGTSLVAQWLTAFPVQEARVQTLVRELKSHMLQLKIQGRQIMLVFFFLSKRAGSIISQGMKGTMGRAGGT